MKRTARIAAVAAALTGRSCAGHGSASVDPNYSSYVWPPYGPFYNLAPHYFPGDYAGAPAYRYWDHCCYWGGRWGYWRYWGWR